MFFINLSFYCIGDKETYLESVSKETINFVNYNFVHGQSSRQKFNSETRKYSPRKKGGFDGQVKWSEKNPKRNS